MQILVTLANTQLGSSALLHAKNWPQLVALFPQQDLALDVIKRVFVVSFANNLEDLSAQKIFNITLFSLISSFQHRSKVAVFYQALNEILSTAPVGVSLYSNFTNLTDFLTMSQILSSSPSWLEPLANAIVQSCLNSYKGNSTKDRQAIVLLTATLLHQYPSQFWSLFFKRQSNDEQSPESKPSSYLFTKLFLVDIKASVPSLQEILNSNEYPATSTRIANSYDIISAFIGFLVQTLDPSPPSSPNANQALDPIPFPPSSLLQLRADISETLSLTIEHLRDRFDSSTAGAAGLHPSARSRTEDATNKPLPIAWDSSSTTIAQDPLTLSQLRTLAIWLREDDNDALRKEAAGIMDLLLNLYETENNQLDFKSPVLIALEGIITVPEGVDTFLATEGWAILNKDIQRIIANPSNKNISLGTDIIRVLLAIVESDVAGPAKEEWMNIITVSSRQSFSADDDTEYLLDFRIALAQLSVELLSRAPKGVRRRYLGAAKHILAFSRGALKTAVEGNTREGLEEVVYGLEELGIAEVKR